MVILAIVLSTVAVTAIGSNVAFAKINPQDTFCTNGGGSQPGGQQPSCTGSGRTQNTENQIPAGSAPPGQNKYDSIRDSGIAFDLTDPHKVNRFFKRKWYKTINYLSMG